MTRYDVVTLGETMIRLTPPNGQRLEQSSALHLHIGGSESNVAVGLARLGNRVCWLSRLTANPLGRTIAGSIAHYGVDTTHVVWTDDDRVGLYFYEPGPPPRGGRVVYDRAGSALSRMQPNDLPADLFTADMARLLHITGITAAVGAGAVLTHALTRARAAGWRVSFDLNYRPSLWSPEQALALCEPLMRAADVLFVPLNDARTLYDPTADAPTLLKLLAGRFPQALLVMTLGVQGAICQTPEGAVFEQPAFPAQEVERLGSGDAFAAGFLHAWLHHPNQPAQALRWGAACAALKLGIPGDFPLFEYAEVVALVEGGQPSSRVKR